MAVEDATESLKMVKSVLSNVAGPARDIVALNAGAAIYAANLTDTLEAGIKRAVEVIESGLALNKLNALIEKTAA